MLKRYWVNLSSNDAGANNNPSNFTIQFNNQIFSSLTERDRIHVFPYRITLPWTWGNISNLNDRFSITVGGVVKQVVLTHGSPTSVIDVVGEVASKLSAQLTGATISWSDYSKRFTISWNTIGQVSKIDFSGANSCFRLLGFKQQEYNVVGVKSVIADAPPDLTQPVSIHVKSNLARRSLGIVNGVLSNTNLLCSFSSADNNIGSNVVFTNDTEAFLHEVEPSIGSVSFQFCDTEGKQLDVNGEVEIVLGVLVEKEGKIPISQTIAKLRNPVS